MQSSSPQPALTVALRDFFLARDSRELAVAVALLPHLKSGEDLDLNGLEYEFNRLFVGPQPPLAPPYASFYLEKQPCLMGESTLLIARFYKALGLEVAYAGLPADFLGLELEAWLALEDYLAGYETGDLLKARRFLLAHLDSWLPLFTERMRACSLSGPMSRIADSIDEWLNAHKDNIK